MKAPASVSHEMVRPPRGGAAGVQAPASVSHEMVKTSTGGRGRGTSPRVRGEPKDGKDLHGGGAAGVEAPRPYGGGFLDRGGPVGIQGTAYIYLVLTTG